MSDDPKETQEAQGEGEVPTVEVELPPEQDVHMIKVTFFMPESFFRDIQEFAEERGETVGELFRWCLGLGKAVWDEIKVGKRIKIAPDPEE